MNTSDLKPYPHYKPSGVEWLGDVPAHWEVRRLKMNLICNDSGVWNDEFDESGTIVLRSTDQTVDGTWRITTPARLRLSESQRSSALLKAGDLVMTKSSGSQAHIGKTSLVSEDIAALNCCFSNFMQRIRLDERVDPTLIWWNLNSWVGREQLIFQSTTTTGLSNLNGKIIGNCYFAFPPLAEQAAIVRYLDHTDGRIRRYLRSRERLIELLKEYRQATIHEAVTQGLDPDVPLKPSGVEWIGDIPAHWEVRRVKHAFRRIVGGSTPSSSEATYWDGTIVWVTPTDISKVTRLRDSQRRITKKGFDSCSTTLVPVGSLVVTSRAPVGNVALAEVPLCTNQGCKTLVPDSQVIDSTYGYQVFGRLKDELQSLANGTTFTEISTNALGNVLLPIPPLAEQTAIAAYLDKQTAAIDAAMARAQREIDLLSEYRTRLIADVVTGQVDVREAMGDLSDGCDTKTARAEYATD